LTRIIAPCALVIALLGAAPASAGLAPSQYTGQTAPGANTSSRSAGGSCTAKNGPVRDLVLRCTSSSGDADVRWNFTVPRRAGSVTYQINYAGSHPRLEVNSKRCSDTSFRVEAKLDSAGRADIMSVTIEYYVS
jgi:hypothetical protein